MYRLLSLGVIGAGLVLGIGGAHAQADPSGLAAALGSIPRDLSPWGMFLSADMVVKAVMVGLLFASLVTWTVLIAKGLEIWSAKRKARAGLLNLSKARSLSQAAEFSGEGE